MRSAPIFLIALVMAGCRPTTILQHGISKYYQGTTTDKILVRASTGKMGDEPMFEKMAGKQLGSKQLQFTSSDEASELKEVMQSNDQKKQAKMLREKGFNGIFEIKLVSIRTEALSTENQYPTRREYRIMDDAHYNKFIQEYGKRENKGALFEDLKVKMDFRVYEIREEEINVVWSARTETTNPNSNRYVARSTMRKLRRTLKKDNAFGIH